MYIYFLKITFKFPGNLYFVDYKMTEKAIKSASFWVMADGFHYKQDVI